MFSAFDLELNKYFATGSNKPTWTESAEEILQFLFEGCDRTDEEVEAVLSSDSSMRIELAFFNVDVREHDEPIIEGDY
jgi:hypothetical protein